MRIPILNAALCGLFLAAAGCAEDPDSGPDINADADTEITITYQDEYTEEQVWTLLEPACLSNGIDPDRCRCLMGEIVAANGYDGAAWLALDMSLEEDAAAQLLARIGIDRAASSSQIFEDQQYDRCTYAEEEDGGHDGEMAVSDSAEGSGEPE